MPASSINDLQHWRDSAKEIRALVDDIKDDASKQKMLRIADDYERLAKKIRRTRKAPDIFKLTGRVTARTGGFTFGLSGAGSSEAKTAKVALARKLAVILHRL